MTRTVQASPETEKSGRQSPLRAALFLVIVVTAAAVLRFAHLAADPPNWLSASAGIHTDEGMYAADARCMAVFGHWAPGDFHGAIIAPVLYGLQLAAFRLFGPDLVVARTVSAIFGLLTVFALWGAVNRAYGRREAAIAALLLAFSAPFVLYNRLALMETPLAFFLTAAFACVAPGGAETKPRLARLIAGGMLFALAVAVKALAWLVLPAYLVGATRVSRRAAVVSLLAVVVAFGAYWLVVCAPYADTLHRMNAYYLQHQYVPHSASGMIANLKRAIGFGTGDGVLPSLAVQSNIVFAAAVVSIPWMLRNRLPAAGALALWLLVPLAAWSLSSYSPTRYFVIVAPALAAIAAIGIGALPKRFGLGIVLIALGVNLAMIATSVFAPRYTVIEGTRNLERIVSPTGIVAGQFAPMLTFGSSLRPLYVQPGLANDDHPVERSGAKAVLVTRSPYWTGWWKSRYPDLIVPNRLVGVIEVAGRYQIDVYRVR